MSKDLQRLKVLSDRLAALLTDPNEGLFTWTQALSRTLRDIESWPTESK